MLRAARSWLRRLDLLLRPLAFGDLGLQRLVGVEQLGGPFVDTHLQLVMRFSERLFGAFAFGDILRDAQQVLGSAIGIQDWHFERVERSDASVPGLNRLFRKLYQFSSGQDLAILRDEVVGLFLGEEVIVGVADHVLAGETDQLRAGLVPAHEPEIFGIFHEDHDRECSRPRNPGTPGCAWPLPRRACVP